MTTLIILLVIASKNRCDVAAGTGYKALMKMLMMTRPSIFCKTHQMSRRKTRPSVNYTKDWLGHWSIIRHSWSGLVWKKVSPYMYVITRGSQHPLSCVLGHFQHGDKQTNEQPGDPRASLLLTSVRRQSFAKIGCR